MKKLRILKNVLVRTKAHQLLLSYVAFLLIVAVIIALVEPEIQTVRDAVWYCCAVIFTTGFGDLVATTLVGRLCSILLSIYSVLVIAIVTGVIVNFYTQIIQTQQKDTVASFADKLERLPELTKEELAALSQKVKDFREKNN